MTITQFVKQAGSETKAAAELGVSYFTLRRWLKGTASPSPLAQEKLDKAGVSVK